MSRKHFSWLLFVTFFVALLVMLLPGKTGKESTTEVKALLPALEQQVNDISWLRLTAAGGVTVATLRRIENQWTLEESFGYRVDWSHLKTLLSDLAQAEIIEAKTANPEYYDRLGVEDVNAESASGTLLEFGEESGLPAVIIGKAAQGRDGQYARLRGQAESALIDRRLNLPGGRVDWLDKDIIDIADAEVVEIEIRHPDGERTLARKVSADDENFTLEAIPEGQEIKSDWTINSLANNLASLSLESVVPEDTIDWTGAVQFRLLTASGLQAEAELVAMAIGNGEESSAEHWIRLQAGIYNTAVESGVEPAADDSNPSARAGEINGRVGGWAYRIPQYKFDSMTKRREDLLQTSDS